MTVELVEGGRGVPARRRARLAVGLVALLSIGVVAFGLPGAAAPSGTTVAPFAAQSCDTSTVLRDTAAVDEIERSAGGDFLSRLNSLRQSQGLRTLVWNEPITGPSIDWSETMSVQIPPGGSSSDPGWLHHARDVGGDDGVTAEQDYVNINSKLVPNWTRLAENVGVGGMRASCNLTELEANTDRVVEALHQAFVNSPGHYSNMVGDHNQVGIGIHIDRDELWVTVRFANGDLPASTTVSQKSKDFIDAAFRLFVARAATSGEVSSWGPTVEGGDRLSLTSRLAVTDNWTGVMVNDLYRTVLGRDADAGGRSYWVDQIARGLQFESVAAEFYGSPEYFSRNGSANERFVRALYEDLLGRTADQSGVDYWTSQVRAGTTRSNVAVGFYGSIESRSDRVSALWAQIIGGAPSANVRSAWADRLAQVGAVRLAAELAASTAYFAAVTQ